MNIYVCVILLILLVYLVMNDYNNVEGYTNTEAISNIASLYNSKKMIVDNLEVKGDLSVNGSRIVPKGVIVAWTGTKAPQGWTICDGQNGTPDLRGRFIYGYGKDSGDKIHNRGGSEKHRLSTSEMPRHSHSFGTVGDDADKSGGGGGYGITSGSNKRTSSEGSGKEHNNMPPYHVLAYIMKI